ncbi:MAG TPA: HD-GYP domain-containing protein [Solirubrobacteraceae bacterium]|nr:HD-GYP domain-containing protein [Solirubrobacteraceae bacterium]
MPIRLSDGELYGTLCAASHEPDPTLAERDVRFLHVLADLLSGQLSAQREQAEDRRAEAELIGVSALLAALEARDHYTGEHSQAVVGLSRAVAERLDLSAPTIAAVEQVALLHDLGKVGIPDTVLQKPGPLTEDEWALMREHPAIGARIVASIGSLAHLASAVRAEHERFDGRGYPDGLVGEQIPVAARITLACDAFHAMTSDRPYRRAMARDAALEELFTAAGSQFDPAVVEALLAVLAP